MAKRKAAQTEASADHEDNNGASASSTDSDADDTGIVNVDFEWFDPQPEHDFHGIKTLLRQLFDVDAQLFDLSALTDLILSQPLLGSTVKVEGNESDPFAFLTVINLYQHRDLPVIQSLRSYLVEKSAATSSLSHISKIISPDATKQVGLILTERLVNIPSEVIPPMYSMLVEEISWAVDDHEPYEFSDYIILSKTYSEVQPVVDDDQNPPQKKSKKSKQSQASCELFYLHPEDEVLHKYAEGHGDFAYTREEKGDAPDSKRAFHEFGILPRGHIVHIQASRFDGAVKAINEFLAP